MLEYLALTDELDRPDVTPEEKRRIISILDRIRNSGYMLTHERENYNIKREMVLASIDKAA